MSETPQSPTRVAIIGGGCAGVAAAFWLSSTKDLQERYQVTLWTRGWRLGGKGASGRATDPANGRRIEEHGLHLWLGFYNNAFCTMRAAFSTLQGSSGTFKSIEDAFSPVFETVFMERDEIDGPYSPWHFSFPSLPGKPGDFLPRPSPFTALVAWLKTVVGPQLPLEVAHDWDARLAPAEQLAKLYDSRNLARSATATAHTPDAALVAEARAGVDRLQSAVGGARISWAANSGYRALILANLGLTVLGGYLSDLLPDDFKREAYDRLDVMDFRAWLKSHGAWEDSLDCGPLQGIYDLAFAYPGGDASSPRLGSIAAGVTLRLAESLVFGYREAPVFKMKAGMGDTIFTPLYDALVKQGVVINFFHALEDVIPCDDGARIVTVEMRRQADLDKPPYRPFVTVKGLRCWPSEPDWSQLVNGPYLQASGVNFEWTDDTTSGGHVALHEGRDFDQLVLAMPPDSLAQTTGRLRTKTKWADMLDHSATVATIATQLWLEPSSAELGFPIQPPPPLAGYVEPLATWADMSHLLPMEDWPSPAPRSIAYYCGPIRWEGVSGGAEAAAKGEALNWLKDNICGLWPAAPSDGNLEPLLVSSYFRANVDPSERYVQAPPGSLIYRLAPDSRPFANLYLAGDWTRLPVSGGCVETAIQSGMVVARAITGADIPIDDH